MRPPSYYFFVILVGALWSAAAAMASFNPNGYYAPNIQQGWFQETEALWPGQRFSIEMAKREDGKKFETCRLLNRQITTAHSVKALLSGCPLALKQLS
jgi:hypothetical protein